MNLSRDPLGIFAAMVVIPMVMTIDAHANEEVGVMIDKGLELMNQEKWQEALDANVKAIGSVNDPKKTFGPRFGVVYYRKGVCELKLKKFSDAYRSFEICFTDFANQGGETGNAFEKIAILRAAEAAMGQEKWQDAQNLFKKFQLERDRVKDRYEEGLYHISVAICHYQMGKVAEGNQSFELALKNRERMKVADASVVSCLQSLVKCAQAQANEQIILDFIEKNRGELAVDAYAAQTYKGVFVKLASDLLAAEMYRSAIVFYQMIPPTEATVDDLKARVRDLSKHKQIVEGGNTLNAAALQKSLKDSQDELRSAKTIEMIKLAVAAYIHEKKGNPYGAYAAYAQLEKYHKNSEKREEYLFQLVRLSASLFPGVETQKLADVFVKDFPNSQHGPVVKRVMLSTLFSQGRYDTCVSVAESMLGGLKKNTPEHDICLYVLGGSYFFLGRYDKAEPLFKQHSNLYPNSDHALPIQYYRSASLVRMQNWSKGAEFTDAFLKKYPDESSNPYKAFALFDLAQCHFSLDKMDESLKLIDRLIEKHQGSMVVEQAYLMRGNIFLAKNNADAAEKSFLKGLELAQQRENKVAAGEALVAMVGLTSDPKQARIKDAVPYIDLYWKQYADGSPYRARMSVLSLTAMSAVGREDEATKRIQELIVELAKSTDVVGLEELINAYTDLYVKRNGVDKLKDHYYNFPGIGNNEKTAQALLKISVIGAYEKLIREFERKDESKARSAQAVVKVLFQGLKSEFVPKELSNSILVKLGDYLRKNTSTPREALPYYAEAIKRQDPSHRFAALLGHSDVFGNSSNPNEKKRAIDDLGKVYRDSKDKSERDFALYRMCELYLATQQYEKATESCRMYLDRETSGFSKHAPKVGLVLAQTYDEQKKSEEAISHYVRVWGANKGLISISAPAMQRWMELLWERNKPSPDPKTFADRQGAYQTGAEYIEATLRFKDRMTQSELDAWEQVRQLVEKYEKSGEVKTLKDIREEKAKGTH